MTRTPTPPLLRLLPLGMVLVLLAACGSTGSGAPQEPDETDVAPATAVADEDGLTVGHLISRIDGVWPEVTSMRITSTSGPVPVESADGSTPSTQESVTVEEWVAPNTRRIVEWAGNRVTNEQVFINGKVYMWGMFVGTSVAPEVGTQTWVTVDPAVVPPDTPVGYRVTYISRAPGMPFASISREMRQRNAREAGSAQVGGRTCTVYTFVDTTQLGERIDYELAIDDNDLPCQIVQRAGGFQNSSVFEVNDPDIQIIAPDAPTPVTGTPEG